MMVSEFLFKCNGILQLSSKLGQKHPDLLEECFAIVKPGKSFDGYWTNADLVQQIQSRVIPISETLHPKTDATFHVR